MWRNSGGYYEVDFFVRPQGCGRLLGDCVLFDCRDAVASLHGHRWRRGCIGDFRFVRVFMARFLENAATKNLRE